MIRKYMIVTPDGETVSLCRWAAEHGVPLTTVMYRWRCGSRDPMELVYGEQMIRPRAITPEDVEWLRETRFARIGMRDEWKIACDLIGIPRSRAKELRRVCEGVR